MEYCGAHQALLPDINTLRAGTVMGLSNGFGAIAGIIVPLGKHSIVKSQAVSFSLVIKLKIVISTINPSTLNFVFKT